MTEPRLSEKQKLNLEYRSVKQWHSASLSPEKLLMAYRPYLRGLGKHCGICGNLRDVTCFSRNKRRRDGFNYSCKSCQREYRYDYYRRSGYKEKDRARYQLIKEEKNRKIRERYHRNIQKERNRCAEYRKTHRSEINKTRTSRAHSSMGRLYYMTRNLNHSYGCNLDYKEVQAHWRFHYKFTQAMTVWRKNNFRARSAPLFAFNGTGEPTIQKLTLITGADRRRELYKKNINLHLCVQSLRGVPRKRGMQTAKTNDQLEA